MQFARSKRYSLGIDMAPLIDIVFLLLIFFMLSSSFLKPSLKLTLPHATEKYERAPEAVVVSIDKDKDIYVNKTASSLDLLESQIHEQLQLTQKKSVHLQGDRGIPYGLFVNVMDKAKKAGATQINLIHEKE